MRKSDTTDTAAPKEPRLTRRSFFGVFAAAPIVAPEIATEIRSQWWSFRNSRFLLPWARSTSDGGYAVPKEFSDALLKGMNSSTGVRRVPFGASARTSQLRPLSVLEQMIEHEIFDIDLDVERARVAA